MALSDAREAVPTDEAEWEVTHGVTCVSCPACAFTFDAFHTDSDGSYSCPACAELELDACRRWHR